MITFLGGDAPRNQKLLDTSKQTQKVLIRFIIFPLFKETI